VGVPSPAERAIARRATRQLLVGAVVVGLSFGASAAAAATTYASTFTTAASRAQIAATTGADRGLAVVLGPTRGIDTVGGYTVYKGFVFLTTIGAVWAVLAGTRLLRGEEDHGRWQLLVAGATRPGRATAAAALAIGVVAVVVTVLTGLIVAVAGRSPDVGFSPGQSLAYGASLGLVVLSFGAVGAVASQLGGTRRTANGLATVVVAVAFVLRMLADAADGLRWLRWATPFGWTLLVDPFGQPAWGPLLLAVVVSVALGALAVVLAGRRDVGRGLLARHDDRPARLGGLGSTIGLATRLEGPTLLAWCAGIAATGLLYGMVANLVTSDLPESMTSMLDRFGARGTLVDQYFGVVFLLVACVAALIPANQIGAAADEETSGRIVRILAGPTARARWLGERLALAAVATLVAALLAAVCTWAAAAAQGVPIGLVTLLGAGLNVVPSALLALGVGAVLLAVAPRHAGGITYVVVLLSVVLDLVASMVSGWAWLDQLSIFHRLALYPSEPVSVASTVGVLVAAVALAGVAVAAFARRDLHPA